MNYKNIMLTLGVIALGVVATQDVEAARLTPQQALSRVQSSSPRMRMPGTSSYELSFTGKSDGMDALYVFNSGDNGFIVASADDRLPALLGYSDSGAFDLENVSPELKWWLSQYADEAVYFFKNEDKFTNVSQSGVRRAGRPAIEPLVKTQWNQSAPYNNDCPSDAGGKCVTGCVATAMAQVINYHKYPATGIGEHSYTYKGNTYSFNYGATTFDWDNMLDVYDNTATEAQNAAVAKLMFACGVGVNMSYTSKESGTSDLYVPYALKKYFGFDAAARCLERNYYSNEEWTDMIYSELAANRPVIYGGRVPDGGGHEFVCDGYREDGYFHINWGWGGYCDGYFLLSALNPSGQGTGGYEGGYNSDQSAVMGIMPASSGSSYTWYPVYATGDLVKLDRTAQTVKIGITNGGIINLSPEPVTIEFYLKAVSETGKEYFSESGIEREFEGLTYDSNTGTSSYSGYGSFNVYIPMGNLEVGSYKAYPYFKTPEGNMQQLLVPYGADSYLDMKVDEMGRVTFGDEEPKDYAQIWVEKFEAQSASVSGGSTVFATTIKNTGKFDYSGNIYLRLYNQGDRTRWSNYTFSLALAAGETNNINYNLKISLGNGVYDAVWVDMYGDEVSYVYPLYVGVEAPLEVTLDKKEATVTEGETIILTANVSPAYTDDRTVTWTSSDEKIATVDDKGVVTGVAPGNATIIVTSNVDPKVNASCVVTVTSKVIAVTAITLVKTAEVVEGEKLTLTAKVTPENATDKVIVWSSSDEKIATVDERGIVTGVKPGKVTIIATSHSDSKVSASCEVTVTAKIVDVTGITLDQATAEIVEGKKLTLTATVAPEDATDKTVTWSSSNEEVATVEDGVVTAVAAGEATITATCGEFSATCKVIVTAKAPEIVEATGVTLDKTEVELTEGETIILVPTVEPETATEKSVYWKTNNPSVATVSDEGEVTAISVGEAIITVVTMNGYTATCKVTVVAEEPEVILVENIILEPDAIVAEPGESIQLVATITPEDATDQTLEWSSSDETVANVNEDGLVTILQKGSAVITATATDGSGVSAICQVSVFTGVASLVLKEGNADVYTMGGILLKRNADAAFISTLEKGIYLLNISGKTYKVVKR